MAGASAHEEIDEPTGTSLQARDMHFEPLPKVGRANWISAVVSRKLAKFDRGASGCPTGPASGLSE
jgi:hypothetical protein